VIVILGDAQEPLSQVDKLPAVLPHMFVEQRPGTYRVGRSRSVQRGLGHQLDMSALAFQQRARKLAIRPRQNPELDRQRPCGKNRGDFS
jgi:hypothetical protein